MPFRVLVLTVGGSCEPLVNAINMRKPDFVYFVCSSGSKGSEVVVDGRGKPCNGFQDPSIVEQTSLKKGSYIKWLVDDPDDLSHCYQRIVELERDIQERFREKDLEIIANYTGGTKTMSVALSIFSLGKENWLLEFNKGPRQDLVKIRKGDFPTVMGKWDVFVRHQMETTIKSLLANHHYSEAVEIISEFLKNPLSSELQRKLRTVAAICQGFDAWDKFDHKKALDFLEPYAGKVKEYFLALKRILGNMSSATGYEKVVDLLLNAERRAVQKKYDDAVARLYRAVELFAQVRLKEQYGIETGNVKLDQIPENLKEEYKILADDSGKIKIGLVRAYELLGQLGDSVGFLYRERKSRIKDSLTKRNNSILAHGENPLGGSDYRKVAEVLGGFLKEAFSRIGISVVIPQMPGEKILNC